MERIRSLSPIDGSLVGEVPQTSDADYEETVRRAQAATLAWRSVPAPKRGGVVREIGEAFREARSELGELISTETGKLLAEGVGEVQEGIDIAQFAVGLSRQLYGLSMHSERPSHRMFEQWHPLGVVGVITAFNFPMAVWAWNALIAAVAGNAVVWKPSELAPVTAVRTLEIAAKVCKAHGFPDLFSLVVSDGPRLGERIAADPRIPLVSATGSTEMGRSVGEVVARRLGRSLLELGGNNAVIVCKDADMDLAVRAILFGAVGTAGQRCTTIRRILVERSIATTLRERLVSAYRSVTIGDPRKPGVLMGPLVHERAVIAYREAIAAAVKAGGEVIVGGRELREGMPSPLYVEPTLIATTRDNPLVRRETFAPIAYVIEWDTLDEAIEIQNEVPQGLSSAIFTHALSASEKFLSAAGSDCGIANVNIGTSGAEIGGAFGGEKDTGGGRESGSDSWKAYMRRQTVTVNYGDDLPLAQGIVFG